MNYYHHLLKIEKHPDISFITFNPLIIIYVYIKQFDIQTVYSNIPNQFDETKILNLTI